MRPRMRKSWTYKKMRTRLYSRSYFISCTFLSITILVFLIMFLLSQMIEPSDYTCITIPLHPYKFAQGWGFRGKFLILWNSFETQHGRSKMAIFWAPSFQSSLLFFCSILTERLKHTSNECFLCLNVRWFLTGKMNKKRSDLVLSNQCQINLPFWLLQDWHVTGGRINKP